MYLENLKLSNFKNYEDQEVDLCDNVNCFVGNNGVGKTNLLDAVYYLSFCKSYFNPVDTQNIKFDQPFFAVHGRYVEADKPFVVSCVMKRGGSKQMKFDKKPYRSFSEHIGKIPLVIITPSDQALIIGGSEIRRKFIDGVISQTDRDYLDHLMAYLRAVEQRNKLLKQCYDSNSFDEAAIQVWDDQLVLHGGYIHYVRVKFLTDFMPIFSSYFHAIAGEGETPSIVLESKMQAASDAASTGETLRQLLVSARQRDRYMQYTTVGTHKDDMSLLVDGVNVKRFGSQGQQKTYLLALKLAQFEYMYNVCGKKPILLLDDIFDKLDMPRVKQLMALVASDRFGQVLLSDTQPGRVQAIFGDMQQVSHRIFQVEDGVVKQAEL